MVLGNHVFFVWNTNGSEGEASKANYTGAHMYTPPLSLKLLIQSHQKQMTKLISKFRNSLTLNQVLTTIGINCMQSLYGQDCPDPIEYTFQPAKQDPDGLNTLICQFTTNKGDGGDSGDGGDGEHWSTYITYPHSSGSKYQVMC